MRETKTTILVTGAAGFIGSHLIDVLITKGFSVIGVDNLVTGQLVNIKHLMNSSRFLFIKERVEDLTLDQLEKYEIKAIAHLASPASPVDFERIPEAIISVNTIGTHHLLKIANEFSARFLFASTSEVYGDPLVHPQPESYWGNVNPQGSRSVYDEAKRLGETYVALYYRKYHLDTRIVRIFNTYGSRMRLNDGRVITNFIQAVLKDEPLPIYGDGEQTRSFCYVDDLVKGLVEMLLQDGLNGKTINLGNDKEISINELAVILETVLDQKLERHYLPLPHKDDPKRRRPVLTKAKRLLNYRPRVDLIEGLEKTLRYFKKRND